MSNPKHHNNIPFIAASIIAALLAVLNLRLARELREASRVPNPVPSAATDVAALKTAEAIAESAKAAASKAVDAAVKAVEAAPLLALSADADGDESIAIVFSGAQSEIIPPSGIKDPIRSNPPVENISWCMDWWHADRIRLSGDFLPETTYTVELCAGWSDRNGHVLKKPAKITFKTPKAKPFFTLALTNRLYWPAKRDALRFPMTTRGIKSIGITVKRAYESNIPLFGTRYEQRYTSQTILSTNIAVEAGESISTRLNSMLDIGALLGNPLPGIYTLEIEPEAAYRYNGYWRYYGEDSLMFALTDIAISAAVDEGRTSVAVSAKSFNTGRSIAGADVAIFSCKHQKIAEAKTGEDGIARLGCAIADPDDRVGFAVVSKDGDISVLAIDGNGETRLCEGNQSAVKSQSEARAFLFSEREICRPEEKFESLAFVRSPIKDGAKALPGAPVKFILRDARGKEIARQSATTGEFGFARAEWQIPKNAALGVWCVECSAGDSAKAGRLQMRVANYVPDRVKVAIKPAFAETVGLDVPMQISGSARYYFDEPLSGGFCNFICKASYAKAPKRWKGWFVGARPKLEEIEWKSYADIDENGLFSMTYPSLATNGADVAYAPVALDISASVVEPGGQTVSAAATTVYHPTQAYIGFRSRGDSVLSYDVALLPALEGARITNDAPIEIAFSLEREVWTRHYEKNNSGRLSVKWKSEMVAVAYPAAPIVVPAGDVTDWRGAAELDAASLENGHYRLTATDGGAMKTVFDFWHWSGEAGERSSNPSSIAIETGAEVYAPGDEAVLVFASPFAGDALVVSGSSGIDSAFAVAVTQGINRVSVKIPKALLSSRYYAALSLVSGEGGEARRLFGIAKIKIDAAKARRLSVKMSLPDVAIPGGECEAILSVADSSGAPCSGLVAIVGIDEGVAALTDFKVADPCDYFFAQDFGSPFSFFDCFNSVYPDLRIMPDGTFGGDGAIASFAGARNIADSILKGKKTARLVVAPVIIPASGEARARLMMPDHSGALRLFAVATDELSAGICEETIKVRNPLSIVATAPRFAAAGDSFTLNVELFSHDGLEGPCELSVALPEGIAFEDSAALSPERFDFTGVSSAHRSFRLKATPEATGARDIALTFTLGGQCVSETLSVNMRAPRPAITRSHLEIVTNGLCTLEVDSSKWIGKTESTLTLSASPAPILSQALAWLADYPYGCLEQTISRAFPWLVANELASLGLIDGDADASSRAGIAVAYATVLQMRTDSGAFKMWPWSPEPWGYGTLLADHFIFEAERMGKLQIDESIRATQIKHLRNVAQNFSLDARFASAYATYILAIAGDTGFINSARNILDAGRCDYPSFLAAAAMMRCGYASEGAEVFAKSIENRVWEDSGDKWLRIPQEGLALFIAARSGSGDIGRLSPVALRLCSEVRGDGSAWGNTRDNGWAIVGLASFAARTGKNAATATVESGGKKISVDLSSKPVSSPVEPGVPVSIAADGTFFATLSTVGVSATPQEDSGRISVSRRYVDSAGNNVSSIKKGDLVTALIEVESPAEIESVVLVDMLPGGFEIEDDSFATRSLEGAYQPPDDIQYLWTFGDEEYRNDRYLWFGRLPKGKGDNGKRYSLYYRMRAVVPGSYAIPAISVEDMYDPDMSGRAEASGDARIEIK